MPAMAVVSIIHHKVQDYDAWKRVYDGVKPLQQAGGVMAQGVFRDEADRNLITVLHTFENAARTHAYFDNPALQAEMAKGGVVMDTMKVEFADEIQFGRL
jgi:quinol monooxygenase YgiN